MNSAAEACLRPDLSHTCVFADSLDQQTKAMAPLIKDAINQRDRVMLFIAGHHFGNWKDALIREELDVHGLMESGRLGFRANTAWNSADDFNSIRLARGVWEAIERNVKHHRAVRFFMDRNWMVDAGIRADQMCHWEATLDCLFSPDVPAQMICMYDTSSMPWAGLHAALRTHQRVIVGETRLRNPHWEASTILEHEPDLNACSHEPDFVSGLLRPFVLPSHSGITDLTSVS